MKYLCFGSLNIDMVFKLDHIVRPGETESSLSYDQTFGGKGFNQSVALAKAGCPDLYHAGAIGPDGTGLISTLQSLGTDTSLIRTSDYSTGKALIQVDRKGQNSIVLYSGANGDISTEYIDWVLNHFSSGDCLILQNEISNLEYLFIEAHRRGLRIILNVSPITESLVSLQLASADMLIINEIEGEALTGCKEPEEILQVCSSRFPETRILLTLGSEGSWFQSGELRVYQKVYATNVVDTTAAGDTFAGYFITSLYGGSEAPKALERASAAASLAVSRFGASCSIPSTDEVDRFLKSI